MRRYDLTMILAFCASLAVHGAIATVLWVDAARAAHINSSLVHRPARADNAPIMTIEPDDVFGRDKGHGNAPNEFVSDKTLKAPFAPHPQAFLSRDPQGPGRIGNLPTPNTLPPGEAAESAGARMPPQSKLEQDRILADSSAVTPQFGLPQTLKDLKTPYRKPTPASAQPAANRAIQNHVAAADQPAAHRPGSPAPAADPAPMSDSESDPFSEKPSVTISEGGVEAHLGRKVKTVRPRLSLAAQLDLLGLQFPTMKLRVHLNPDGKVKKVDIVKSTGSESADQEVKLAVYQWQFAPRKVKSNAPDIVSFEIDWR